MTGKQPLPGPGCFQWNTGAWFGSLLGGTGWLLVGAAVLALPAPPVAGVWLACAATAQTVGVWLWRRRDRLRPYPALQLLLLTCGGTGVLALVTLHVLRPGLQVSGPRGVELADQPRIALGLLALVAVGMGWFHLLEWGVRKERAKADRALAMLREKTP